MDGQVRAGVAFLHHLLHRFRFDARLAVGAYYQGPASVARRGLAPQTRRFVANVLALRGAGLTWRSRIRIAGGEQLPADPLLLKVERIAQPDSPTKRGVEPEPHLWFSGPDRQGGDS